MIKTAQKTVKVSHPPTFQLPRNPNLDPHCTGRPQARFPDKTKQADSTIVWTQIFGRNPTNKIIAFAFVGYRCSNSWYQIRPWGWKQVRPIELPVKLYHIVSLCIIATTHFTCTKIVYEMSPKFIQMEFNFGPKEFATGFQFTCQLSGENQKQVTTMVSKYVKR